ncbi:ethylene-insensitive protein 2-like [Typha latifolia]|uniref:ethylene-insensitive protein 2-like n=1 Tax=Typha latifolia TaxID=4733 RepID=UPI003C2ADBC7
MGIEEEVSKLCSSIPGFGEGCVWHADLIVSFGIWCIRRILELLHVENRPELWGRYTYVLNRLQGILIPAFLKHRHRIVPCKCLDHPNMTAEEFKQILGRLSRSHCTTADLILQMLKGVEAAISRRRGQAGTAAGDVAFPKGKENVVSVLKRYKRRLSKKSSGTK